VKHPSDQDLLMLAHRSLGPLKFVEVRLHVLRCAECRRRCAEFGLLSSAVASTLRLGMPAWKPGIVALKLKLLIGVTVLATGVLVTEAVHSTLGANGAELCPVPPNSSVSRPYVGTPANSSSGTAPQLCKDKTALQKARIPKVSARAASAE